MVVGEDVKETDVLVIGGGSGGYTAAITAAREGAKTTLVERTDQLGGVCLNVGCIPSKALIHVADIAALPLDAKNLGLDVKVNVQMNVVQANIERVMANLSSGISRQVTTAGAEVVKGTARFVGARRAAVDMGDRTTFFEFRNAIIATGSRPVEVPALPFDGSQVIDSTAALALTELPRTMAVVGGGYIGLELGTVYAKLGVDVTIVEALPTLLATFDQAMVRPVYKRLAELGITVMTAARVTGTDDCGLVITKNHETVHLDAEVIVVAVGRRPNTEELDLQLAGVTLEPSGHIRVDEHLRASATTLAVGDVTAGPQLAHRASAQAEVAGVLAAGKEHAYQPACIPSVVYTDPEVVSVGLTLEGARTQGIKADRGVFPMSASGRAATLGRSDGRVEVVFDRADGTILGIHMVGAGVSELSGEASLAIEMQTTLQDLALTVHAHPTLTESIRDAAAAGLRSVAGRTVGG
jgi:dihydrolipoamide dehydrogenase